MSKYQLWSRDEYGQGSIVFTSENVDEVIKRGKEEVGNINVSNALTVDDRERNWEAYMVTISAKDKNKYIYGGPHAKATDTIYIIDPKGNEAIAKLKDIADAEVRVYLGNISNDRKKEEDWLAKNVNRKIIDNINDQDLNGKVMFFVKRI